MTDVTSEDAAAAFEPLRPKLMRVAYRTLGSVTEAEDVVQEAFLHDELGHLHQRRHVPVPG